MLGEKWPTYSTELKHSQETDNNEQIHRTNAQSPASRFSVFDKQAEWSSHLESEQFQLYVDYR